MIRKALRGGLLVLAAAAAGYFLWQWSRPAPAPVAPAAAPPEAKARVQVAAGRFGPIVERITVYGDVIPAPGSVQTVTLPFETQVLRVMVNEGQRLSADDLLVELKPGPDAALQLEEARNAVAAARQNLDQIQGRFKLQLVTNDQVLQASQAHEAASVKLASLESRQQAVKNGEIRAAAAGLVSRIAVHEGQIVPAGAPLIDIVEGDRLEVRLGVEPEDIGRLKQGNQVALARISGPGGGLQGTIRRLSQVVNPATRLVDIFVELPPRNGLLLSEPVTGRLAISAARGFIVPRSAILPAGGDFVLFTVRGGKAVRHSVKIGLENDSEVQILSPPLPSEPVVVTGNYVLRDGMAVEVEQAK